MPPDQLDVIIRVAGATLLLLAAATSRSRLGRARALFIPLAVCLSGFLAGNTPDPRLQLGGPLGSLAVILAGYAAVFLWWFCLAVFDASFRPRGPVLAIGTAWIAVASADRGLFGERLAQVGLSWVLLALGLLMVGHLAWRLLRDREGDLVDGRRSVRRPVVVALGGQLAADIAVDLLLGIDWQPQAFSMAQNGALLAFTVWLINLAPRREPAARARSVPSSVDTDVQADPVLARLRRLMEADRVYLDPELTFADFVEAMGAPEKVVRRLINRKLGYDHFRTFLNSYRVAEARRRLADPARRGEKLIAIALDSGFASLPSFNRVFREVEGRTPSAFRDAALAELETSPGRATAMF
ncbi:helix-turn-helix domain-containing protein [Phenylobacterium sp.]|uniref:AraC family transcriptional regulator n=1 Tax=Phenylobacterium sp. TaxID=1871053 RepID=UPI002CA00247|nr:helix-turn-helix domain-containing protein [Phenylobacterium sp.]HVI32096.1 helix-turn-helix domain-containing protein [Phenylobacterium sp.]